MKCPKRTWWMCATCKPSALKFGSVLALSIIGALLWCTAQPFQQVFPSLLWMMGRWASTLHFKPVKNTCDSLLKQMSSRCIDWCPIDGLLVSIGAILLFVDGCMF